MNTAKLLFIVVIIGVLTTVLCGVTFSAFNNNENPKEYNNFDIHIVKCNRTTYTVDITAFYPSNWFKALTSSYVSQPFFKDKTTGESCLYKFDVDTPFDDILEEDDFGNKSVEARVLGIILVIYSALVGILATLYFRGID